MNFNIPWSPIKDVPNLAIMYFIQLQFIYDSFILILLKTLFCVLEQIRMQFQVDGVSVERLSQWYASLSLLLNWFLESYLLAYS